MPRKKTAKKKNSNGANVGYEAQLWQMADALRGSMDAAEYKHVVLGLIFLKYISDAFEEQHAKLEAERAQGADPEDPDEYRALSIFWVPPEARWSYLKSQAKQPKIGELVDDAMSGIERDNPSLKSVLPKDYARPGLDKQRLGQLIDLISNIDFRSDQPSPPAPLPVGEGGQRPGERQDKRSSFDLLGRIYEYFLSQFASAEGKKGGEFYTPRSVVKLLVEMLEPYSGRVYDPCCGSSGMFVQSIEFIRAHASGNGNPSINSGQARKLKGDISIYGQESNYTTWRLAKMNLAIRGIDGQIAHGDTFHNDRHPDLKADFILANPPFNVSDWRGELLRDDKRWQFGKPPVGNANFAWVQHIIYHLAPTGIAGFVLANGSMSSNQSGEGEIRKNIIEADLVDCMIALPGQLFYSTQIPACLWFIARNKSGQPSPAASRHPLPVGEGRGEGKSSGADDPLNTKDKVLMVDARNIYRKVTRKIYDFSPECVFRPKSTSIPGANRHAFRSKSALVPTQIGTPCLG
jgi:type I restriction enzyme M protein